MWCLEWNRKAIKMLKVNCESRRNEKLMAEVYQPSSYEYDA